jgi:S-formylglutathione hydrolase
LTAGPLETLSEHRCFGGVQGFYRHRSSAAGGPMRFSVFLPDPAAHADGRLWPAVYFLAGLECTEQTFPTKAGAQRAAASLGLALVT